MRGLPRTPKLIKRTSLLKVMAVMREALNSNGRRDSDKFWPRLWRRNQSPRKKKP